MQRVTTATSIYTIGRPNAWKNTISVLVAKGRARVGVAASAADWPKRIRDLLSAPLRLADDLSCKMRPSLSASRPCGPVAADHSASVHEREFEMSLFSLPVN